MLLTIIRIIIFLAALIAIAFGFTWLAGLNGEITINLAGKEYPLTVVKAVVALVVLLLVFWFFIELVRFGLALLSFVMGDKKAVSRFFGKRAQNKGMKALESTVEGLATGDSKAALSNAYRADRYLDSPVLTGLLVAQSAKAAGKPQEAEEAYKKILGEGKGRFAAVRGLMHERLDSGDKETAIKLAEKAYELKPRDLDTVNTLFELQVDDKQWDAARKTLKAKAKLEKLPSDFVSRREAVMALCEAKSLDKETDGERYGDRVMLAHRLAPNLVPASVMAAEVKNAQGNRRAADTILVKAWNAMPHPDIARAYASLVPDETPQARLRRFRVLTRRQKDHPETRMLEAELLIAAEDFPGARRALGDLEKVGETSRSLSIMAAIEHGEGADEAIVRAYLARAAVASRGPQWVCNHCAHVHSEWVSDCLECERFDTLDWKLPPEKADDQTGGLGVLLPLLASKPSDESNGAVIVAEDAKLVSEETPDNAAPIEDAPAEEAQADADAQPDEGGVADKAADAKA